MNLKTEFKKDMGENPMGNGQKIRQMGNYIIEYYEDSFTFERNKTKSRLQVYRRANDNEDHFRKWKQICDFEDYDGNLWDLFNNITEKEIMDRDN